MGGGGEHLRISSASSRGSASIAGGSWNTAAHSASNSCFAPDIQRVPVTQSDTGGTIAAKR
jgi:hypothetical protein